MSAIAHIKYLVEKYHGYWTVSSSGKPNGEFANRGEACHSALNDGIRVATWGTTSRSRRVSKTGIPEQSGPVGPRNKVPLSQLVLFRMIVSASSVQTRFGAVLRWLR